jgi:hypothetical protein
LGGGEKMTWKIYRHEGIEVPVDVVYSNGNVEKVEKVFNEFYTVEDRPRTFWPDPETNEPKRFEAFHVAIDVCAKLILKEKEIER